VREHLIRYISLVLVAVLVATGLIVGIDRAGEHFAARIPDIDLPAISDIPTPAEVVETISEPEPFEEISPATIESMQTLAELTTVEYVEYTTIVKGTDSSWLRWARGDSIEMLAVAEIGAGIDFGALTTDTFQVDPLSGIVTFRMPVAQIHYAALDNDATHVYDRSTGIFTHGDPQLETEARQIAETVLVESAIENGILGDAERAAAATLSEFIMALGYSDVVILPPPITAPTVSARP